MWNIINGNLLPRFNGKKVSLTGLVNEVNRSGLSFEMSTVDNVDVKIVLRRPLDFELKGYVEVHGTAQGKTVMCDEMVQFSHEKKFDKKGHNTLCILLNTLPNLWRNN